MSLTSSIFLDFHLPTPTTWFYLSLALVIGLFFRFDRLLSLRNWDLLTLFLLVPAILFLREARLEKQAAEPPLCQEQAQALGQTAGLMCQAGLAGIGPAPLAVGVAGAVRGEAAAEYLQADHRTWLAYLCLLLGSGYFIIRCFIDLGLARRPNFTSNLNTGGLIWFGLAMVLILAIRTLVLPTDAILETSRQNLALNKAAEMAERFAPFFWISHSLALTCHLAVLVGLVVIGARHFQNPAGGIAAAVLYLLLPYTAYFVKDLTHVFPAALLLGAFACYRRPLIAGLLLGTAAGLVYFPVVLFPLWFGFYRGRGAGRFAVAFLLVLLAVGTYFYVENELRQYLASALSWPDWQAFFLVKPSSEGLWSGLELHSAYRLPLAIAYLSLVLATVFWPSPKDLAHLLALSTALIIGVQLWQADRGGTYVLWYLPLMVLVCVRPSLAAQYPPDIDPATDWWHRLQRWGRAQLKKLLPQPVAAPAAASTKNPD